MEKTPEEMMTLRELAKVKGSKPVTSWERHAAEAEIERRRSRYMFWSTCAAAASALFSAIAAGIAAYGTFLR